MSTKLLLTVGDSYTANNQHASTPHSWAYYLGKENNLNVVNLARSGADNSYILGQAMDGIIKHKPNIAIAMWSDPFRLNLFDIESQILDSEENLMKVHDRVLKDVDLKKRKPNYEERISNYTEQTSEFSYIVSDIISFRGNVTLIEAYTKAINHSLRLMCIFEDLCKLHRVHCIHCQALPLNGGNSAWHALSQVFPENQRDVKFLEKAKEDIKKTDYYKLLDDSPAWIGHEWCAWNYVFENNLRVSEYDHHPNDEGHKELAKVLNKYLRDGIRPHSNIQVERPVYIYD